MLIVHLFVSYAYVNLCHSLSSTWCQGLAVTYACGSSWTFLFTFLITFVFKTFIDKYINQPGGRLYTCCVTFRKAFDTVIHTGIK